MNKALSSVLVLAVSAGLALSSDTKSTMTSGEVKELVNKASTPEEHHRLAQYFTQKAENMESEAAEHEELAKQYAQHPPMGGVKRPMSGNTAKHCTYFAQSARKAAAEDHALAAAHENMAKSAH